MTEQQIEALAREAGVWPHEDMHWVGTVGQMQDKMRHFAALVAEQCAQQRYSLMTGCDPPSDCAGIIRAAFPMPK